MAPANRHPEVPVVPNEPLIGKLTLTINGGFMWNNVRTEDNGEDGSSILFEIEHSNNAALPIIWVVRGLVAAADVIGIAGIVLVIRRRREEEE